MPGWVLSPSLLITSDYPRVTSPPPPPPPLSTHPCYFCLPPRVPRLSPLLIITVLVIIHSVPTCSPAFLSVAGLLGIIFLIKIPFYSCAFLFYFHLDIYIYFCVLFENIFSKFLVLLSICETRPCLLSSYH